MKNRYFAFAIALLVLGFASADAAAKTTSPISITFNAPDKNDAGKDISISITINVPSGTKELSLKVTPETGLEVKTPSDGIAVYGDKPEGGTVTETVVVTASMEGRLYLDAFASGVVNGKKSTNIVSIPLNVGEGKQKPMMLKQGRDVTDSEGNKLTILPAEEPKK